MQTAQMWLVAHLSETQTVTRVEVLLGTGNIVFIDEHPRRQLHTGVDVWPTFNEARDASLKHYSGRIRQFRYLRDTVMEQQDPTWTQQQDQHSPILKQPS